MASVEWQVQGMKCGGCENNVKEAVSACSGVKQVMASHKQRRVEIEYDESVADLIAIRKAIADRGFTVSD